MTLPMAREGIPFLVVPGATALAAFGFHLPAVGAGMLAIAAFMAWFFRDPDRETPREPGIVVAAADGRVLSVVPEGETTRLAIFMSPLNVHVNRAPLEGKIVDRDYRPGRFRAAQTDAAARENERNAVVFEGAEGRVTCVQVAGLLARRIVCRVGPGDRVDRGQRYGMIRFGSRMEMIFPPGLRVVVEPGEKVLAGQSVVARRGGRVV